MAKIRFEDIQVKVIEVDGIDDPTMLLRGLGLENAKVKGGITDETTGAGNEVMDVRGNTRSGIQHPEPPVPEVIIPKEVPTAAQIDEMERSEKSEIEYTDFEGARRLRDVVQVFMDRGITETDDIVKQCLQLRSSVAILKRVLDIEGRIPRAVEMWRESNN